MLLLFYFVKQQSKSASFVFVLSFCFTNSNKKIQTTIKKIRGETLQKLRLKQKMLDKKSFAFFVYIFCQVSKSWFPEDFPKVFRRKTYLFEEKVRKLTKTTFETKKASLFLSVLEKNYLPSNKNYVFVRDYGDNLCFVISLSKV